MDQSKDLTKAVALCLVMVALYRESAAWAICAGAVYTGGLPRLTGVLDPLKMALARAYAALSKSYKLRLSPTNGEEESDDRRMPSVTAVDPRAWAVIRVAQSTSGGEASQEGEIDSRRGNGGKVIPFRRRGEVKKRLRHA